MQRIDVERWPKNRVVASFESSTIPFDMAPKASLTDAAARRTNLDIDQDGALIDLTVQLNAKKDTFRMNGRSRGQKRDR